jgi:hypothetical protein
VSANPGSTDCARSTNETDGRTAGDLAKVVGLQPIGKGQRRHRIDTLARKMQRLPARDQQLHARSAGDQARERAGAPRDLLDVVQYQQQSLRRQEREQRLSRRLAQAERLRDRRMHQPGFPDRREHDRAHAMRIIRREIGRRAQGKPRLARSRPALST